MTTTNELKITGKLMNSILKGENINNDFLFSELFEVAKINNIDTKYLIENTDLFIGSVVRSIRKITDTILSDDSFLRKVRESI